VIAPWNPTGYGQQATISTAPSAQLQSLQAMQKAQLDKINNGPDRYAMAKQQYDNFTNATAGDYQREQQDALNRAGEHGYLRSGQLTNAYGDLAQRRAAQVDSARNNFLGNALEGTISDNRANLGAVTGIADSTYSQDAGIRAEQERQQATANNLVDRTNAQGANVRDEQRTERGYQNQLAQQAIAERVRQQQAEYQQQMDAEAQAERLYRLGQSGDPQQAYMQGARTYGNDAANSGASVAALMKLYAQRQNPAAAGGY
jgi:methionyl-tRNA synthetase